MKLGNAAWGFRETPIEEQFKITADMGLDIIELGIANAPMDIPLDVSDDEIGRIRGLSEKYGVRTLCGATGNDFSTGTDDVEKIKRVIDICVLIGIKYLRIFAGFTPLDKMTDSAYKTMTDSLSEVCAYAEEKTIVPVIETHGAVEAFDDGVRHIMSTTTDLEALLDILDKIPDNARICYDPANLYAVGVKKPWDFFEAIKERVAYAHFKDFEMLPSGHLRPSYCGASDMDWKKIIDAMHDFQGAGFYEYENIEDVTEGLKKCSNFMKGLV